MEKVYDLLKLLRVKQWYKNSMVFIPIIFSFNLFNVDMLFLTFIGFVSLSLISSSFYIINDMADIEKDRHHPEKRTRPLVSKRIKINSAGLLSLVLFNASIIIAYFLSLFFLYSVLTLFILSLIYSFFVRKIAYLDIIFISLNFVIRTISGTFIINEPVSSWVILSTFFISIFLVSSKRIAELNIKKIEGYRSNFRKRDAKILEFLLILSVGCVFVFFSIYSILTEKVALLISVPVALYIISCFVSDLYNAPEKIRNPEKFIFNKNVLVVILLWLLIVVIVLYTLYK